MIRIVCPLTHAQLMHLFRYEYETLSEIQMAYISMFKKRSLLVRNHSFSFGEERRLCCCRPFRSMAQPSCFLPYTHRFDTVKKCTEKA